VFRRRSAVRRGRLAQVGLPGAGDVLKVPFETLNALKVPFRALPVTGNAPGCSACGDCLSAWLKLPGGLGREGAHGLVPLELAQYVPASH
jgi:hypothetical protein